MNEVHDESHTLMNPAEFGGALGAAGGAEAEDVEDEPPTGAGPGP